MDSNRSDNEARAGLERQAEHLPKKQSHHYYCDPAGSKEFTASGAGKG